MSISILIADDEMLARKRIHSLISKANIQCSIHEADNGLNAIEQIRQINPDIVFLDIQMTDITGFDVLSQIDKQCLPIIVFVTAFDHFAVKAFEVQALDFILKPFKNERFNKALDRAINNLESSKRNDYTNKLNQLMHILEGKQHESTYKEYLKRVVIKLGKKYYFVSTNNIKYIVSSSYYVEIYTLDNSKHTYRISMSDFISKLDPSQFVRVSRSAILNIHHIKEIISEGHGDYCITMDDNQSFSLTKKYRDDFLTIVDVR